MKKMILYTIRLGMRVIYFFVKLFPIQENKVTMLSRQSDEINIDFEMLLEEFQQRKEDIKVVVLCKKMSKGILEKIKYFFYTIKCMYNIATSHVCIIDGYCPPISALKHKEKLKVIQIWHALGAIKKFGYQTLDKKEGSDSQTAKIMKMHYNYDYITCASEKTKEYYSQAFNTEKSHILTIGMPRIDYLLSDKINQKKIEILKKYPQLEEKKVILYVPTFRKGKKLPVQTIINNINHEEYQLCIKVHPLDKTEIPKEYQFKDIKTIDLLGIADFVITDYSAITFEACILNKQVFFYLYDMQDYLEERGINVHLIKEVPHCTFYNIKDIINVIENRQYNYEEINTFKEKYIQTIDTNNTKRIVELVVKIINE